MKFIYRHEEGERLRVGIGFDVKHREIYLALPTSLGPNPRLAWIVLCMGSGPNRVWGQRRGIALRFDFFRRHAMHIPNDMDSYTLYCRRCNAYSGSPINQYCGGFMVSKNPGSQFELQRGWEAKERAA
jgi:hypothetical protein